jgi:hypothetical protein
MQRRTVRGILAATLAFLLGGSAVVLAATPTTEVATANDEFDGSGNADYLAWTFISPRSPNVWRVKVRPTGGSTFSLNDHGRWSTGSVDRTGSLLSYTRFTSRRGHPPDGDIYLYDLATGTNVDIPPDVDTSSMEFFPSISEGRLLFIRRAAGSEILWLVTDLDTGFKVPLLQVDLDQQFIANKPNLIGNWVTYSICRQLGCNVFRYNLETDALDKVPNPLGKYYYAPSADLAGNVYFERSGAKCGWNAKLMKWTGTGEATVFHSLPRGHDLNGTSVFDDGAGNVTLYADVFGCAKSDQNIISFTNP